MVLRRLSGRTENTAPVLTLITQFGGGKTHTLASLYHLANAGGEARNLPGVSKLLTRCRYCRCPRSPESGFSLATHGTRLAGRETPWIDLARQLAGDDGVAALGSAAKTTPPGTESLARVFAAANAPVLLLFDEALNFVNRHRRNGRFLPRFSTKSHRSGHWCNPCGGGDQPAPQSSRDDRAGPGVAGSDYQGRATRRTRPHRQRRVRDQRGSAQTAVRRHWQYERVRQRVSKAYADWCFERSARLPSEWTAVDTATSVAQKQETSSGTGSRRAIRSTRRRSPSFSGKWRVASPVPADSRRIGDACAMDFVGV